MAYIAFEVVSKIYNQQLDINICAIQINKGCQNKIWACAWSKKIPSVGLMAHKRKGVGQIGHG